MRALILLEEIFLVPWRARQPLLLGPGDVSLSEICAPMGRVAMSLPFLPCALRSGRSGARGGVSRLAFFLFWGPFLVDFFAASRF